MNLPNKVTLARLIFALIILSTFLSGVTYNKYVFLGIFIFLSLTDFIDGYLARKVGITKLGKLLDPIADKVLVLVGLIYLLKLDLIALWILIIIATREFLLTLIRMIISSKKGIVIPAGKLGKLKTVFQIIAVCVVLLGLPFNWHVMLLAVILTVISGMNYLFVIAKSWISFKKYSM